MTFIYGNKWGKKLFLPLSGAALAVAAGLGMCGGAEAAPFDNTDDSKYEAPVFEDEQDAALLRQTRRAQQEINEQRLVNDAAEKKEEAAFDESMGSRKETARERRMRKKKEADEAASTKPVHMTAEHAEYDNSSGDFHASGNVVIIQGTQILKTDYAEGNMKTGDLWLRVGAEMQEPGMRSRGDWGYYNMNSKTGEIEKITGRSSKDKFAAPHAQVLPDKIVADKGGSLTRCPAVKHVPCFSIEAKTFEIYPKDKMIARDVKVYFRGKHIYSRDIWINDFNSDKSEKLMPRVGWDGHTNGWYFKIDYEKNFGAKDTFNAEITKYSRAGFKPNYSYMHDERNFSVGMFHGWEEDDDVWYEKQTEWRFRYKNHHIIDGIPLSYDGYWEHGLWKREGRNYRSWHTEYAVFLRHDPIYFFNSKNTMLNIAVGRKFVHESRTDELRKSDLQYYTLTQRITPKIKTWVGYYRENQTSNLFDIGQPDMAKELRNGLSFSPDSRNTFSIINRYDLGKREQYETDYQWIHKFCCWALEFRYEKEQHDDDSSFKVRYYFYW